MRALLVATALVALPIAAAAQSHAGTLRLSGGTGFTASSTTYTVKGEAGEAKLKTQTAAAEGAFLFTPFLGLGASVQYSKCSMTFPGSSEQSQSAWTAGPLVAHEYPLERAVLRGEVGWMWGHETPLAGLDAVKTSGWAAAGGVGFMLAPSVSLDLGVSYSSMNAKVQGVDLSMGTFAARIGFSVYLGGAAGGGHATGGADTSGIRTTGAGNPSPW